MFFAFLCFSLVILVFLMAPRCGSEVLSSVLSTRSSDVPYEQNTLEKLCSGMSYKVQRLVLSSMLMNH
jgi:hypothetical protein